MSRRTRELASELCRVLNEASVTTSEGCTALINVFLDTCVDEIARGNPKIATEMRRVAQRLEALAAAPADQVRVLAEYLSDELTSGGKV